MYNIDNKYHPSFISLISKINERGYRSPYAYVSFETKEGHTHRMPIGNGYDNLIVMGDNIENIRVKADSMMNRSIKKRTTKLLRNY